MTGRSCRNSRGNRACRTGSSAGGRYLIGPLLLCLLYVRVLFLRCLSRGRRTFLPLFLSIQNSKSKVKPGRHCFYAFFMHYFGFLLQRQVDPRLAGTALYGKQKDGGILFRAAVACRTKSADFSRCRGLFRPLHSTTPLLSRKLSSPTVNRFPPKVTGRGATPFRCGRRMVKKVTVGACAVFDTSSTRAEPCLPPFRPPGQVFSFLIPPTRISVATRR